MTVQFKMIHALRTSHSSWCYARWLLTLFALPIAAHGGCSCYGPDPDTAYCTTHDGSPLTDDQLPWCTSAQIIGATDRDVIIAVPFTEPPPDMPKLRLLTKIFSVSPEGDIETIREFDYLPGAMASNGNAVAWSSPDQTELLVAQRDDPDPWTAVELHPGQYIYDGEYVGYLEMRGSYLALQVSNSNDIPNTQVFDVDSKQRILEPDDQSAYAGNLSEQSFAVAYYRDDLYEVAEDGLGIEINLYSLSDQLVVSVTRIPLSNAGFQFRMDESAQDIYWTESDPVDTADYGPPVRLMRWDFSTHEISVLDSQFDDGYGGTLPFIDKNNHRTLMDVHNENIVGGHSSGFASLSFSYFVRPRDGVEREVSIMSYPDWHNVTHPIVVEDYMVWLDNDSQKVIFFEPQSQHMIEIGFPGK